MKTVTKFSGTTAAPSTSKFDWTEVNDGNIYKAVVGADYASYKGFLTSMSRYANDNDFIVERFVATDGKFVEFKLTPKPIEVIEPETETEVSVDAPDAEGTADADAEAEKVSA